MSTGKESEPTRPLADDASFIASLADLDAGLDAGEHRPTRPAPAAATARPAPAHSFPLSAPSAPASSLPPLPKLIAVPGRRPLLDIFPADLGSNSARSTPVPSSPAPTLLSPPFSNLVKRTAPKPHVSSSASAASAANAPAPGAAPYETFYGLHERPFSLSTDPKFLYSSGEYDRVAQQMLGAIGRRDSLVLLTGEMGMGKTTLCRAILDQLDRRTLTSFVTDPILSMTDLLKTLLIDFGVVSRDEVSRGRMATASQGELTSALQEFLVSLAPLQAFAVVIIDEAQTLPPPVLHALHDLVSAEGEQLIQIVLVGQPALAAQIDRPAARDLSKAVSLRLVLGPLAGDEVPGYVLHRLRVAGTSPRVDFDDGAAARLLEFSGGKPRLVNLLCDRALAAGFSRSASIIDEALVNGAAEDLDMAPPPRGGLIGNLATVSMLVLLLLIGAAAGALTFHGEIAAILSR